MSKGSWETSRTPQEHGTLRLVKERCRWFLKGKNKIPTKCKIKCSLHGNNPPNWMMRLHNFNDELKDSFAKNRRSDVIEDNVVDIEL